jgi:hypothetical protein
VGVLGDVCEERPVRGERARKAHDLAIALFEQLHGLAVAEHLLGERRIREHLHQLSLSRALRILQHVADDDLGALRYHVRLGRALRGGAEIEHRADTKLSERVQVLSLQVIEFNGAKQQPGAHPATSWDWVAPDVAQVGHRCDVDSLTRPRCRMCAHDRPLRSLHEANSFGACPTSPPSGRFAALRNGCGSRFLGPSRWAGARGTFAHAGPRCRPRLRETW